MGIFDTIRDTVDDARDEAEDAVDEAVDQAQDAARNVGEAVEDVQEGAEETASEVSEGVQEAAGEVSEGAQNVADEVSQGDLGGAVDEASDTVRDVSDTAGDTGSNVSDTVTETVENVSSGSRDTGSRRRSGGSSGGSSSGGSSGSTPSREQLRNTLTGQNVEDAPTPEVNPEDARDADIVSSNPGEGSILENPTEREISNALNTGEAETINEAMNQDARSRNARTVLTTQDREDQAQRTRDDLGNQIENIQGGPTKQDRLSELRDRKREIDEQYQDDSTYRIDRTQLTDEQAEQLGISRIEGETSSSSRYATLEGSSIESRIMENSGLNNAINNLESSDGLYTITTTNEQGEQVTRTVSQEEAVNTLSEARNELSSSISDLQETRENAVTNLFNQATGNQGEAGNASFSSLDSSQDQSAQGGTTYRANPGAVQEIRNLQDQLSNSVMTQDQRQDIRDRIQELKTEARQPAEQIGGTDIPGQSYMGTVGLPEDVQNAGETTTPTYAKGPVGQFTDAVSERVQEFQATPEAQNVDNVELENSSWATRAFAGVDTLASSDGYTYVASAVPGGRSPQDVAEESIERRMNNPQSGPSRVVETALESPAGLVATAGAGAAVGAGAKTASVLGGSGRIAQAARAAGYGAAGLYAGSQGAEVQRLASEGKTTQAGGEALRTAGELGAFGRGYRAFQRMDSPTITRTSVSQAENTLRQVDDSVYRGAGRMTVTSNFQRGPFSTKVLGLDETGQVQTQVNYATIADDTSSEVRGTLTQEIPNSDDTVERTLEGQSRVLQSSEDGSQTVTRDLVRTKEDGRLFQRYRDFEDNSINRRMSQEQVNRIRAQGDDITAQGVQGSFPNTFNTMGDTAVQRNVNARASQFESTSLNRQEDQLRENFGESSNLVFLDDTGSRGGSVASGSSSGGGGQKSVTVQELGGYPAGGSPVNQRGLYSQARSAAREAVTPNLNGREYVSGGAGFGVVNQAEAAMGDGQRAVNQFGDDGSVQNYQAESDVRLQRGGVQSQRFSEGAQGLESERVQVERTGAEQFQGSISGQVQGSRATGENIESISRSPAGNIDYRETDTTGRNVGLTDRVSRVRNRGRGRTDLDMDLGVGQRGRQDLGQRGVNVPGLRNVPSVGTRVGQTQRSGVRLSQFQRNRPGTQTINVARPTGRTTGRPGMAGFDFEGSIGNPRGEGSASASIGRGQRDPTYDLVSTIEVESTTGEQAEFENDRDKMLRKQEELGAFARNKPVQAQNLEYENSSTGGRRFF